MLAKEIDAATVKKKDRRAWKLLLKHRLTLKRTVASEGAAIYRPG
jgi:hypothetical protein